MSGNKTTLEEKGKNWRRKKKLKKEGVLDKKDRPVTISRRQVYKIINKK